METIIQTAYQESIKLLQNNSSKHGLLAARNSSKLKNKDYATSIYGRDASISVLGMTMTGDKKLKLSARRSLLTLAKAQSSNGQIPFYAKPDKNINWHYYLGSIDSTLWWLLAIKMYEKNTGENISKKLDKQIIKAINWLQCQEHPNFFLLTQNETNDWADIMPRSGFVLYSNALWHWLKQEYKLKNIAETKKYFNLIFDPRAKLSKKDERINLLKENTKATKNDPTYSSFVSYMSRGDEVDFLGNSLACIVGLAPKPKSKKILNFLKNKQTMPGQSILYPLKKNNPLWKEYMNKHKLNLPHQYHNGGVWPYIGGFWVLFAASIDKKLAKQELLKLAELNQKNNWQFNEWFHGQTGRAMGVPYQSWNAAMYILAYKYLYK